MTLTPQPGHVFVEYVEPLQEATNIALPATVRQEERRTGKVVAVGEPGTRYSKTLKRLIAVPMELKVGDYVLFKKHTADVFSIQGRTFFSVKEEDVVLSTDDAETFKQLIVTT